MLKEQVKKHNFGLIGKDISYSFSKQYFTDKFNALNLNDYSYQNFDLQQIEEFHDIIKNTINLKGLNVTIPYKEEIIDFLDEIDPIARNIGAVNTIKILDNNRLKGFNTDVYGFENSLKPLLKEVHKKALILGTGGASKAINFVLNKLKIETLFVSRNSDGQDKIAYHNLSKSIIREHTIIVNCTPLGTYPDVDRYPNIPYQYLTSKHLLFDLIYNPAESNFLKKGKEMGCTFKNGLQMLQLQAEKSWEIWTR
ncbi:MAG: shikimate dehydrogenase [Flavobacteriaceae bacterium]|nr:shikimate dehydrogenase [Flavobacteriaceae bacterium]